LISPDADTFNPLISKVGDEAMTERKLAELVAKLRASFVASGLDEKLAEETASLLKEHAEKKAEETAALLTEYAKELEERIKAILRKQ